MNSRFNRILDLAKRTGSPLIITDRDGVEAFVVMDFDIYEGLLGSPELSTSHPQPNLAKKGDFEHINQEISAWKEAQKDKIVEELAENIDEDALDEEAGLEDEERFYLEPIE